MKNRDEQKIVRQLSSCLIQKFSGFLITSIQQQEKPKKKFRPIDVIYKPTKRIEIEPICYLSEDISKAYSSLHSEGKKGLRRAHKVYPCYYCNKFYIDKPHQKRHLQNCSGKPGVIYGFNNQCLISYQDNFKNKGDLPFAIYFDFETTTPTDNQLDPEPKKLFVVSYVMIVAFQPALKLERIIVYRSFAHSIEQLTSLSYLTRERITFIEPYLIKMLKYIAFEVSKKKSKTSLDQMFSIESALVKKTLLKWFNVKYLRQFANIDTFKKLSYEQKNPIK